MFGRGSECNVRLDDPRMPAKLFRIKVLVSSAADTAFHPTSRDEVCILEAALCTCTLAACNGFGGVSQVSIACSQCQAALQDSVVLWCAPFQYLSTALKISWCTAALWSHLGSAIS